MTDSSRNGELDLAIIGGGAAGVLVAIQVLRQAQAPLALAIFEPASQLAQGIAYATPWPEHLLNVPAAKMSAFPDQSGDFLDYLLKITPFLCDQGRICGNPTDNPHFIGHSDFFYICRINKKTHIFTLLFSFVVNYKAASFL